jgi:hypothetical protein
MAEQRADVWFSHSAKVSAIHEPESIDVAAPPHRGGTVHKGAVYFLP